MSLPAWVCSPPVFYPRIKHPSLTQLSFLFTALHGTLRARQNTENTGSCLAFGLSFLLVVWYMSRVLAWLSRLRLY